MLSLRFTGFENLGNKLAKPSKKIENALSLALGRSIAMVETESKRRTPVDTGQLRSSIGGRGGFKFVRGLEAGVGTNVKYAVYVHENLKSRHPIGQAKFMEHGARAAIPFMQKELEKAGQKLVQEIAK